MLVPPPPLPNTYATPHLLPTLNLLPSSFNLKVLIFQETWTRQWLLLPSPLFYFCISFLFSCLSSGSVVLISLWALFYFIFFFACFFLFLPVTLSDSLQMDVVSAFQSGTSFQGALRRQASNSSQQHDVTNVSSPTHVAFSTTTTTTATAVNSASATVGCECVFSSSAWDSLLLFFFFFVFCFSPLTSSVLTSPTLVSSSHLTLTHVDSLMLPPNVPPSSLLPPRQKDTSYITSSIMLSITLLCIYIYICILWTRRLLVSRFLLLFFYLCVIMFSVLLLLWEGEKKKKKTNEVFDTLTSAGEGMAMFTMRKNKKRSWKVEKRGSMVTSSVCKPLPQSALYPPSPCSNHGSVWLQLSIAPYHSGKCFEYTPMITAFFKRVNPRTCRPSGQWPNLWPF